mmetsp:Transcript_2750/g.3981  ORF Transcript_2750/g.3981 Transcript_2750/m.3981 type:complete len:141 (+) Transcript_2750:39-461(+)
MDRSEALKMQKILQQEVKKLQALAKKRASLAYPRSSYMTQLAENEGVIKELDLLSEDDKVYKLMGPCLVLQELEVAKRDVHNRISVYKKQLKQIDSQAQSIGKDEVELRKKIQGLQQLMVNARNKAVEAKLKAQKAKASS